MTADLILFNGKLHTVDRENPTATAVAIKDGRFIAVGNDAEAMAHKGATTQIIDLKQRTVIPGLNDSHLHLIRGGLNYNLELRWEGVPSVADALRMLKDQAARTPTRSGACGGWLERIPVRRKAHAHPGRNQPGRARHPGVPAAPVRPRLAQPRRAQGGGLQQGHPNPPGGEIQRDKFGNPTGMLIARPNAMILYATLAKGRSCRWSTRSTRPASSCVSSTAWA
jgi:predicted amidohydrolase YtcJ